MHPARCIPLNFRYRQDPPNTDWWVMHQPPVVEDESPVLADAESWLSLSAMPAPVQPGTIHHREERGEVVVTVLVPCDSHGRIEPDVQQAHQQIADEFFWQLRPTAELV